MAGEAVDVRRRLQSQLLAGRAADSIHEAVTRLLAVQAQDLAGARLAIRARARRVMAADVDRALSDTRSVVITWLNRGTLHLVAAEDYWWLHPLTTPPVLAANGRMLERSGVDPVEAARAVRLIDTVLTADGPTRPADLRERLRAAGIPVAGPVGYLLLARSGLQGITVRGPVVAGEQAYALTRDWLGPPPGPFDRDLALQRLARRYLDGHGPAGATDLARWAGIGLRAARTALGSLDGAVDGAHARPAGAGARPRLLGPFDPLMFGWVDRRPLLGAYESELVTSNGLFRPAILVGDRIVGGWRRVDGAVQLSPFEPLSAAERGALEQDASDLVRFEDGG